MVTTRPPRVWSDCTGCGKPTQSVVSICRACQATDESRPVRRCTRCGSRHRAKTFDTCAACRRPSLALTGGRWVIEGRVQRWKPWTDEERRERDRRARRILRSAA